MIPAAFDYTAPTSLQEALAPRAESGDHANVMAGGQSQLPSQRKRLNWERFSDFLRQCPLPRPRIMVQLWGV